MHRFSLLITLTALAGVSSPSLGDTVIDMPLPPGTAGVSPQVSTSQSVATTAVLMVTQLAQNTPSDPDSQEEALAGAGLESLERYAARSGRTRNHYNATGYVSTGNFRTGWGASYLNYRGPLGWGWGWGSPLIINNNYGCGQPPATANWGTASCGRSSFTAIGVF